MAETSLHENNYASKHKVAYSFYRKRTTGALRKEKLVFVLIGGRDRITDGFMSMFMSDQVLEISKIWGSKMRREPLRLRKSESKDVENKNLGLAAA